MKRKLKRLVSLILVCLMLVSSIPFNVLAQEQQVLESQANETVSATAFSGTTPDSDNPNSEAAVPAVQSAIPEPNAAVISSQSLPAEETITTAETEDLDVTLIADKTSPQNRNTTVVFTANATGGVAPYSYEFLLDGETVVSTANTASILITEAGEHSIEVIVTDATAGVAETLSTSFNYVIKDNPLVELTIDPDQTANHYVNEEVTLKAVVDGGTSPLSYRFYYQLGSASKVEIKNPDIDDHQAQVSFTPVNAGNYTLLVEIYDNNLLKTTDKISLTVLSAVSAKSFTVDKPSGQNVNTTIKLTANGSGGKSPYTYEFEYQLNGGIAVPIDVEKLPATNTVEFTPETPGIYTFRVTIRDNGGLENENSKTIEKTIDNYRVVNGPVIEDFTATNKSNPEKPTYIQNPVILKVDLAEGTGTAADSIKYTYTIKNGSNIIKTITLPDDTYEFTPTSPGTYNFTVKAVDSDNLSATSTTSLVVLNNVAVTLKADKPSGQNIHTDIKLTATASGGEAPYNYEFEYEYMGETKILQYESQSKTATFSIDDPEKTGNYTLRVKVTDANGDPLDPAVAELIDYQIKNPPVIDSFTANPAKGSTVYAGTPITLEASVTEGTGENPLTYKFTDNGVDVTDTNLATPIETCVFTPTTIGSHTFEVTVSDGVTTVKQKITNYKVTAGVEVTSLKVDKPTGLVVGDTIRLTAAGKNGVAPYNYAFYYDFDDGEGTTTTKTLVSATDAKLKTVSQKLNTAGEYTFYVEITDKNGNLSTNGRDKKVVVTVTDPPVIESLKVTDADDETKQLTSSYAGDEITLTATPGDPTADLDYTFSYKVGTKTTTIVDTDGTPNDETATFKLENPGSYTFYVTATDSDGLAGPTFALPTKFTVLKAFSVKSLKPSKPSGQNTNTEIKLTATAQGGQVPYKSYAFYKKAPGESDYTPIDGDPTNNYVIDKNGITEETKREAGTYTYKVVIIDANGTVSSEYSIDFEFFNPFVVNLTADKPSETAYQADTVTLTATVDTGTDTTSNLDYRFYWKMGTETGEIDSLTDQTARTQTATFEPATPGTYNFFVDVIDANNIIKTAKIASYKVLETLTVDSLVVDQAAPQNIGTTIKLTANCSGGKTPYKYQFFYQLDAPDDDADDVTTWRAIGTQTTSKSINYRLSKAGTYQFKVQLIDANDQESDQSDINAIYEDYVAVDKPIITGFTASPSSKQYVGEPIGLNAAARGGSGTYTYTFSYVDSKGETITKEVTDAGASASVTLADDEAIIVSGNYQFKLTVKDQNKPDNTAEKTITYTIVNKPAIKTFSADKTGVTTGSTVKLTAAGQYGIGTYQYKFYIKKDDGDPIMIRSFSSTPTVTYRLTTAGTYTFYVDIKDSKLTTDGRGDDAKTVEVTVTD